MLMNCDIAEMVHYSNKSCFNSFNNENGFRGNIKVPTVNPIHQLTLDNKTTRKIP